MDAFFSRGGCVGCADVMLDASRRINLERRGKGATVHQCCLYPTEQKVLLSAQATLRATRTS